MSLVGWDDGYPAASAASISAGLKRRIAVSAGAAAAALDQQLDHSHDLWQEAPEGGQRCPDGGARTAVAQSVLPAVAQPSVADRVAPYKKVRAVEFIDSIPKSTSGKILRKDLRVRKD